MPSSKRVTRVGDTLNPPSSASHNQSPQTHWENACPTFGSYKNHSCIDIRIGFLPWSEENRIELHAVISLANVCFLRESRIANTPDRFLCERIQCDNGSEFISREVDRWAYENGP